jgi:predicted nucleic acid-binding protein
LIFVDVNIFCDCATQRSGWEQSTIILFKVQNNLIKGFISSLTVTLLYFYIKNRGYDIPEIREHTKTLIDSFEIVPVNKDTITQAFECQIDDFEDAIQFHSAKSAKCEMIITRNTRDFISKNDEIEILTPEEYIERFGSTL